MKKAEKGAALREEERKEKKEWKRRMTRPRPLSSSCFASFSPKRKTWRGVRRENGKGRKRKRTALPFSISKKKTLAWKRAKRMWKRRGKKKTVLPLSISF